MVILADLPGVVVEVLVDGIPVKEHESQDQDQDEHDRTVTRYIEAASEQVFAVTVKLLPEFEFKGNCVVAKVFADGNYTDGAVFVKAEPARYFVSEGVDRRDGKIQKYRFAGLKMCESQNCFNMRWF